MLRAVILVLAAVLATAARSAGEECINIDTDLDRLTCYDKALGRTAKTEPLEVSSGKWQVVRQTSKMTDEENIALQLNSEETINCGWNNGEKIALLLRCKEGRTSMYFVTGCHMAGSEYDSYGSIDYRLDQEKAKTTSATPSTDNRALGLWSGNKAVPFAKQMLGKSTLVARMTPYGESPFTATFELSGLDKAIEPLRRACNW